MNYLDLKLGYACNNNCIHCVIKDNYDSCVKKGININLSTLDCYELMKIARKEGAKYMTLTGGEPTLRKDIFDILHYAKSLNFRIFLQSNGRAFYYLPFTKKKQIGHKCLLKIVALF